MILPENKIKSKVNIEELFADARNRKTYLKVCAPMVRYSKLQFRTLVRKYGVDLCFTPMIMADSFCQSSKARFNEFSTSINDQPVIAQFAAKTVNDYQSAAEMISPYVDGIDLNCGCPQRWAISTGYGCALLNDPEMIRDLTQTIKRNIPEPFSVSVKIRVQKPLSKTINLCRQLEKCGVTFITVHGRTPAQKIGIPSDMEMLAEIKKSIAVPLIANGDVKSLQGADDLYEHVQCDGVMAARGILSNPAMFSGVTETPLDCIQMWTNLMYAAGDSVTFQCLHHHLTFMMEKQMRRRLRVHFNNLTRKDQVFEFLEDNLAIVPQSIDGMDEIVCEYNDDSYIERRRIEDEITAAAASAVNGYNFDATPGQFYLDYMETNMFDTT